MVVQHNLTAINANRYFGINNTKLSKSLEKLSSGYAINRAGDNAAGLAVSEKMRAQISGINQGVKNAQDGISMVQTFEGALTETDSILQRMRTLATQSANGTYQNDVDREAIQLEYDQLNDELNQIADTDFNGVVVLNGGTMADGLEQVKGDFNYANKKQQVIDKATEEAQKSVDAASSALEKAKTALTEKNFDLSANGQAKEWNTVDDTAFNKAAADKLWAALGYTKADGTTADTSKTSSIDVTFKLGDDGKTWTAVSGKDNAGNSVDSAKLTAAITAATTAATTGKSGLGGVKFTVGDADVNAIFDATKAKAGDTITLTFTNADSAKKAPTNVGFKDDSYDTTGLTAGSVTTAPKASIGELTDADMTKTIADTVKALDGQKLTYTAAAGALTKIDLNGVEVTAAGGPITLKDAAGNTLKDSDGKDIKVFAKNDNGKITISTVNAAGTGAGKKIMEITAPALTATTTAGTFNATLAVDVADYKDAALKANVKAGKDADLGTSNDAQEALAKAEADYANAVAEQGKLNDFETAKAFLAKNGVSVSDSNDASTATLTYQKNITLQVGARTKDSVNFTFKYDSDGLGELAHDMDCSARGLRTDKLSLATQEDANKAIDKIDNALNKVSMVRGTFGAIQNRLEHKIDNLNVTSENLTSAESRIRDTNMAEEMMNFTKNQILSQASQSMLAQANQLPQGVLSLLQ